jgi:hypothetical protein
MTARRAERHEEVGDADPAVAAAVGYRRIT